MSCHYTSNSNCYKQIKLFHRQLIGETAWEQAGVDYDIFCVHSRWNQVSTIIIIRDRGSTRSASARRLGGNNFLSRSDTASLLKTLKLVPTAAMSGARHK